MLGRPGRGATASGRHGRTRASPSAARTTHLSNVAGAATRVWVAAKVAAQRGRRRADGGARRGRRPGRVRQRGRRRRPGSCRRPPCGEAVLDRGRARPARPGRVARRCGGGAAPSVELSADGLRIEPAQAEALIRAATRGTRMRSAADCSRRCWCPDATRSLRAALDPVLTTPDVPSPMAMALIDRDPNWFLPGHRRLPGRPSDAAVARRPVRRGGHARGQRGAAQRVPVARVPDRSARHADPPLLAPARTASPTSVRSTSGPASSGRTCSSTARRPR